MRYLLPLFFLIVIISCSVQKQENKGGFESSKTKNDTIRIANDSLEYEIIIIEPGFEAWLATQRPRGYYNQNFLEQRNILFVTIYNQRVLSAFQYNPNLYQQQIDYKFNVDYGYEVNYLLYNYFMYFQQKYRQRLR